MYFLFQTFSLGNEVIIFFYLAILILIYFNRNILIVLLLNIENEDNECIRCYLVRYLNHVRKHPAKVINFA